MRTEMRFRTGFVELTAIVEVVDDAVSVICSRCRHTVTREALKLPGCVVGLEDPTRLGGMAGVDAAERKDWARTMRVLVDHELACFELGMFRARQAEPLLAVNREK